MKRILAIIIATFLLLSTFVPFVFADYSSDPVTLWDRYLYEWSHQGDGFSFSFGPISVDGSKIGSSMAHTLDPLVICSGSSDHLHHADSVVQDSFGSDSHGYYVKCVCKDCHTPFKCYSEDVAQGYNDTIHDSGLDNGISVTPATDDSPSGLIWSPSFDAEHIDIVPLYDSNGNFAVPSPLYQHFSFPHTFNCGPYFSSTYSFGPDALSCSFDLTAQTSTAWYFGWSFCFSAPVSGSYSLVSAPCYDSNYSSFDDFLDEFSPRIFSDLTSGDSISLSCLPYIHRNSSFGDHYAYSLSQLVFSVVPSSSVSIPSVPSSITINNNTYPVVDIDFNSRTVHVTDDRTIIYDDDHITIKEGDTVIQTINYIIETDPGPDPGGDDSSTSHGGGTVDPGDASGSGGSGCCEQCALLLRQVNSYLLQIQTLVDQINDKLGPESDNYMEGIYNLLVEINTALDNLPTEPHKDYEAKLTTISNQLANIWGDLETIKTSLSAVQTNTATTNQKLDTVHADLQAVLAELQTQRGILNQILSVLQDLLRHVTSIDSNVEELANEEDSQSFFDSFILKFHFIGDIFSIIRQLFADITNDAATVTFVDNGDLPIGDLTSQHFPVSGSPVPVGTAPQVLIKFPSDTYHGADLSGYSAIDMSWYAPYKSRVDALISGFLWIGYLWLLFKRAPGIVRGAAMIEETNYKIEDWKNGGKT